MFQKRPRKKTLYVKDDDISVIKIEKKIKHELNILISTILSSRIVVIYVVYNEQFVNEVN